MFSKSIYQHQVLTYHYTYKITVDNCSDQRKYYIGSRTSNCIPEEDVFYHGSCKSLKEFLKSNPNTPYKKEVLAYFPTRYDALEHEIQLHAEFDVARNPEFFNRARQTSTKFSTEGMPAPNLGIPHSEHTKHKMSKSHAGKPKSEAVKRHLSITKKGKPNGHAGLHHSIQGKENISKAKKGIPSTKIVCRLSDRKELDAGNWSKYIKQFLDDTLIP